MAGRWRTQVTSLQSILVEACWRPREGDVAGDFHEVVDLEDGRVAVVIGDAPGFGPRAAELAEDLRGELRHAFRQTDDAREVLSRLDARLCQEGDELVATVACAVVDARSRAVHVANAGHLPILSVDYARAWFLNGAADPPLGVSAERRIVSHPLHPDDALFLYTDGLVERRGESLDEALVTLLEAGRGLAGATGWASELARRTTSRLGQPTDDATVVSVRLLPGVPAIPGLLGRRPRVVLHVYVDRRDLRSEQTEGVVADLAERLRPRYDVHVETTDVTAPGASTVDEGVLAGVLATPTVVRVLPEPAVRVVGGLRSVDALARALQLPLPEENR